MKLTSSAVFVASIQIALIAGQFAFAQVANAQSGVQLPVFDSFTRYSKTSDLWTVANTPNAMFASSKFENGSFFKRLVTSARTNAPRIRESTFYNMSITEEQAVKSMEVTFSFKSQMRTCPSVSTERSRSSFRLNSYWVRDAAFSDDGLDGYAGDIFSWIGVSHNAFWGRQIQAFAYQCQTEDCSDGPEGGVGFGPEDYNFILANNVPNNQRVTVGVSWDENERTMTFWTTYPRFKKRVLRLADHIEIPAPPERFSHNMRMLTRAPNCGNYRPSPFTAATLEIERVGVSDELVEF